MQSVKFVMRELGNTAEGLSSDQFSQYLEYNYLSKGYRVFRQTEMPIMDGKDFKGYRVFMTLVKDEESVPEYVPQVGGGNLPLETKGKRGRPPKAS